jgi:hypothetical protein
LLAWLAIGGLIVTNAIAPWNQPYLLDILHAAAAGAGAQQPELSPQ